MTPSPTPEAGLRVGPVIVPLVLAIVGAALMVATAVGVALEAARADLIVSDNGPPGPRVESNWLPSIPGAVLLMGGGAWLVIGAVGESIGNPSDKPADPSTARRSAHAGFTIASALGLALGSWGVANPIHYHTAVPRPTELYSVPGPLFLTGASLVAISVLAVIAIAAFRRSRALSAAALAASPCN